MSDKRQQPDDLSEEEIARRRDAAVRRALQTPPKPKTGKGEGKERKPQGTKTPRKRNPD